MEQGNSTHGMGAASKSFTIPRGFGMAIDTEYLAPGQFRT